VIVDADVQVALPRQRVFDLMADARNEPTWNSHMSRQDLVSPGPVGAASEFATVYRGQQYAVTFARYEPPSALTFDVVGRPMRILGALEFAEAGDGTRVSGRFELRPNGFMKLVLPVMGATVRKDFQEQLASFKRFCEAYVDA
jgi:uncharacterized membrane protein